ncbi:DUF222 domain-containing protein [Nocardioides sp. GCM10027113]|uniref:HNH endonuclease signature motif containing protein n=1 Tax=unclassified Nocardioides TaxID=2615069 RepID=UPI003610D371
MTAVHQLPAPDLLGAVDAALEAVGAGQVMPAAGLDDDGLADATRQLAQLEARVSSWRHELLAEAQRRDVAARTGDTGTDAWAGKLTGSTRELMAGGLRTAGLLREKYHETREAFAAGRISLRHVKIIVHAAEQSPPEATPRQVADAEAWLVARATGDANRSGRPMNPTRLRQAARRMFECVDAELAQAHAQILLGRRERHAQRETYMGLHDNGDGTFSGKFTIPELHGRMLRDAIDRLTAPRRLFRGPDGRTEVDESAIDPPNIFEVRGQALLELIEHLPTDGHAANGVALVVKVSLDELREGLGVAGLDTGAEITAGEARRLACNAGIIPAVLDGASQPLDLGRTKRLFSSAQRKALALLHDTCAIDGCERPFAWTEIHHPDAWSGGGSTDLDNALPLCGHHHRRAHDDRFRLTRTGVGWRLRPRR